MIAVTNTAKGAQMMNAIRRVMGAGLTLCMAASLSGCVSLGAEPPESLLTLMPTNLAPVGMQAGSGGEDADGERGGGAIAVLTPEVPAKLDVRRVPVTVSDTEIAYLQEAVWIEKPARLFRRLLGETLRSRVGAGDGVAPLVIDSDDTPLRATTFLRGTLIEMGYDARTSSVVVRYDAVRSDREGVATTRRFEARESGVIADPRLVGGALNRAANTVAAEVVDWMIE